MVNLEVDKPNLKCEIIVAPIKGDQSESRIVGMIDEDQIDRKLTHFKSQNMIYPKIKFGKCVKNYTKLKVYVFKTNYLRYSYKFLIW